MRKLSRGVPVTGARLLWDGSLAARHRQAWRAHLLCSVPATGQGGHLASLGKEKSQPLLPAHCAYPSPKKRLLCFLAALTS